MVKVVIGVGSNCGDRRKSVSEAINWLKTLLIQVKVSDIYETPCALKTGKPYMNAVLSGVYQGIGYDLENILKEKEIKMGRTSECRDKGDVPVDLDIVIMDNDIIRQWDFRQKFFQIGYTQII